MTGREHLDELDEEIQDHLERDAQDNLDRGMTVEAARDAARRKFGNVTIAKEDARAVWIPVWLDQLLQDTRYGVRTLRRSPGFSAVVIATLALGIGANTAIFSLVNSLLLRPLPVAEPQRLVTVRGGFASNQTFTAGGLTYPVWDQIRQRASMFDGALAWSIEQRFNLRQGGEAVPVDGVYVSGDFFSTLGVPALVGRTFTAADDVPGGGRDGPVAVISYGLWQQRFGGAPSVIGTTLVVEGVPVTVVGVTPAWFFGVEVGRTFDLALPITAEPLLLGKNSMLEIGSIFTAMLRLKPGQSPESATAVLRAVQPQIREATVSRELPYLQRAYLNEPFTVIPSASGTSRLRQRYERPLVTILVVVGLVLLVACANIANLLLARAAARRHELSVRVALGASRSRLARQLLIESLVLAGIGAAVGLLLATWGSYALLAQLSTWRDRYFVDLSFDWRVLAFTAVVACSTAVLFGMAPALLASRTAPLNALKEHGQPKPGAAGVGLTSGLVVIQVALSLVLVVVAGLFVRTFEQLSARPLGFDSDKVLVVNIDTTRSPINLGNRISLFERLIGATAAVPGVAHAAGSLNTPMGAGMTIQPLVDVPGGMRMPENGSRSMLYFVTPGWFETYGTAITMGRDIDDRDTKNAPQVMLVNDAFVHRFFSTQDVIGATVAVAEGPKGESPIGPKTVIGVVSDTVFRSLREEPRPMMFAPLAQWNLPSPLLPFLNISIRSSAGSPILLARSVTTALTAVDRDLRFMFPAHMLADQVNGSLAQERIVAMLSKYFGLLALLLAGLGLYGVTSYSVTRRRAEIGVRMALGAAPSSVVRLVLSRVLMLVGIGVLVGAGASLLASQFVASLLYGVQARDPVTLVGAAVILAVVGTLAGWLPAYRASQIEPAEVLRNS